MPRFASGIEFDYAFRSPALPAQELALLLVLGPVDLTASKAPIENIDRCGASFADGRPIRYPDNNCSQSHENEEGEDHSHGPPAASAGHNKTRRCAELLHSPQAYIPKR